MEVRFCSLPCSGRCSWGNTGPLLPPSSQKPCTSVFRLSLHWPPWVWFRTAVVTWLEACSLLILSEPGTHLPAGDSSCFLHRLISGHVSAAGAESSCSLSPKCPPPPPPWLTGWSWRLATSSLHCSCVSSAPLTSSECFVTARVTLL